MLKILFNIIKNNKGAVIALALLTFVSAATSLMVVSRVMRKFALVSGRNLLQGAA